MSKWLIYIGFVLIFTACEKATYTPIDIPEEGEELPVLVQKELDRKYTLYRANQARRCQEAALKKAIKYVDSIIIDELQFDHIEDTDFPNRPSRPRLPEGIELDTLEAEPI